MNKYKEMKERHGKELNSFPMKFVFGGEQFVKAMKDLGLNPDDTDKVYAYGDTGGFFRKSDAPMLHEMLDRHNKELKDAIAGDETGDGFIYEMFLYELQNHEFGFTEDVSEALEAVGYSEDDVVGDAKFTKALEKAKTTILKTRKGWLC